MKYLLIAFAALVFMAFMLYITAVRIAKELVQNKNRSKLTPKTTSPSEKRFKIQSPHGYSVSCLFIPVGDGMSMNEKIVFILHQFGSNKEEAVKYSEIFRALGFSVIIPDMRSHGETGGEYSSMGFFEKDDIGAVIRWAKDCYGQDLFYGIFGLADGGTAALIYAQTDKNVKFVITDSSFGDLHQLYKNLFSSRYKIKPFPMLNFTELAIRLMAGFSPKSVSPVSFFKNDKSNRDIPIMLIHGDCDRTVSPKLSIDIYNAKDYGVKTLYLIPDSDHLNGFDDNPEVYTSKIHEFIDNTIDF